MNQENYEKKKFLQKAYRLAEEIEINQEELNRLTELSTMLKGLDYSQTKIQTSGSGDAAFVNKVADLADIKEKINAKLMELKELRNSIWKAIYTLDNTEERLVCLYRYLKFYDWETVADKMHLSLRQVYRVHGFALKNIKILKLGTKWH